MEYLEILLQNVNKRCIDSIINKDLKIENSLILSSHFYDKIRETEMKYCEIDNLLDYFMIPNTANMYLKHLDLGIDIKNVMVIMSFDEELGDITFNFSETDFCNGTVNELKLRLTNISEKLLELQNRYNIPAINFGYESVIDDENILLNISQNQIKLVNKFSGTLSDTAELVF